MYFQNLMMLLFVMLLMMICYYHRSLSRLTVPVVGWWVQDWGKLIRKNSKVVANTSFLSSLSCRFLWSIFVYYVFGLDWSIRKMKLLCRVARWAKKVFESLKCCKEEEIVHPSPKLLATFTLTGTRVGYYKQKYFYNVLKSS